MRKIFKVATRPSLLAMTQTRQTVEKIKSVNPHLHFEIIPLTTHGDKIIDKPLVSVGGTGLFVKELEQALIEGKADFAVHSLKDMPGINPEQLVIASFVEREDPRDVLLLKDGITRQNLVNGAIIGTGSPRRQLQLQKLFPGSVFRDLRGNIDTRLKKLESGEYSAIVLAAAGINRLSISISTTSFLSVDDCIPAIGQGAIALQCRKGDEETISMLKSVNHTETEIAVNAERAFMRTIGGGCKFPLAAHAIITEEDNLLNCIMGELEDFKSVTLTGSACIGNEIELGINLANKLKIACSSQGIVL